MTQNARLNTTATKAPQRFAVHREHVITGHFRLRRHPDSGMRMETEILVQVDTGDGFVSYYRTWRETRDDDGHVAGFRARHNND